MVRYFKTVTIVFNEKYALEDGCRLLNWTFRCRTAVLYWLFKKSPINAFRAANIKLRAIVLSLLQIPARTNLHNPSFILAVTFQALTTCFNTVLMIGTFWKATKWIGETQVCYCLTLPVITVYTQVKTNSKSRQFDLENMQVQDLSVPSGNFNGGPRR